MSDALAKVVQQLAEACATAQRRSGMLAQLEEVETARSEWRWLQDYEQDAGRFKVGSLPMAARVSFDLRQLMASSLGSCTVSWLQDHEQDAERSSMAALVGCCVRQVARCSGKVWGCQPTALGGLSGHALAGHLALRQNALQQTCSGHSQA